MPVSFRRHAKALPFASFCLFVFPLIAFTLDLGAQTPVPPAAPPSVIFAGVQTTVTTTGLKTPQGVAVDNAGNLYIADTGNNRVLKVTPAGVQTALLSGTAMVNAPAGVAVDASGTLYVADSGNNRILAVNAQGVANLLGSGFSNPVGVAVDNTGNVFVADTGNNRIVEIGGGIQTTLIASGTLFGGIALSKPAGVSVQGFNGNDTLYVADTGNNRVFSGTVQQSAFYYGSAVGTGMKGPLAWPP